MNKALIISILLIALCGTSIGEYNTFFGSGANQSGNYNTAFGISAGSPKENTTPSSNVSIGYSADFLSSGSSRIAIGDTAGTSGEGSGVIVIGTRAGEATEGSDLVLIGANEFTNKVNVSGVISINGGQIYVNKTTSEFSISPEMNASSITNAPFYYKDGIIHINAGLSVESRSLDSGADILLSTPSGIQKYVNSRTSHSDEYVNLAIQSYDIYLAPYGNDGNTGVLNSPKATIEGCIESLGAQGGRVGVLPGSYAPVALNVNAESMLYSPTGNCHFVALGGKERTCIIGEYSNQQGYDDGAKHSMAFAKGNQTFEGFTFCKIGGYRKSSNSAGAYNDSAPAFSCITLKGCAVQQCSIPVGFSYGAFNTCYIKDTVINDITFTCYSSEINSEIFSNCAIVDSRISGITLTCVASTRFFGIATESYYSAFDLPAPSEYEVQHGGNCVFKHCTFVWNDTSPTATSRINPSAAENCYFCVGQGALTSGGVSNVFATCTNTMLDHDYVPSSISCPAIRASSTIEDAGWKDSGLGELKSLAQSISSEE